MRLLFYGLLLFCHIAAAQNGIREFGNVSMDEMKMVNYDKDTSATAVILFDVGKCYLNDNLSAVIERRVRIKFLKRNDIDEWATITQDLDHSRESLSKLKGITYNLEGGAIVQSKLDPASIIKTKFDKATDQVKFTLPNVKEGSIIEYTYNINTTASLLPSWTFQTTLPVILSQYETHIPKAFTFRKDMQGFLPITRHEENSQGNTEVWVMADVPAFKKEPYMTTPKNFVSKIRFYLAEVFVPGREADNYTWTWEEIVKDLNRSSEFGVLLRSTGFLSKPVETIVGTETDPEKKMKLIYNWVKENIEWNKDVYYIPEHLLRRVLDEKKGSSGDINMLLTAMMKKAGLPADAVLISTRSHGMIRQFNPKHYQFNDVLCMVTLGTKQVFLDGTDKTLPINALPSRCLNGQGLVVSEENPVWVPIVSGKARTVSNAEFTISPDGEISGTLSITRDGEHAGDMRKSVSELGKEKYSTEAFGGKGWEISKSEFSNLDNAREPVKEQHELVARDHAQAAGDQIYLNPYLIGKLNENPFKSESREYPVDYGTGVDNFYIAKIVCPEGYTIEELPKPKVMVLPDGGGKFVYSATANGNIISFVSQLMINKSLFLPEQYPALREFYSQMIAKQAEQIVLKKKN